MPYDPTVPTPLNVVRRMAGDTSGDPASETMQDAEYLAIFAQYGVPPDVGAPTTTAAFYRAAAEALRGVAIRLEARPSSMSQPEEGSISFSGRTTTLREQAAAFDAKAATLEASAAGGFGTVLRVRGAYLTGRRESGSTW